MSFSLSLAVSWLGPKINTLEENPAFSSLLGSEVWGKEASGSWSLFGQCGRARRLHFCPLLLQLQPPGTSGARLASSDRDPSFTTFASFCLGPCRSCNLFLEQERKQNVTQEFEKTH